MFPLVVLAVIAGAPICCSVLPVFGPDVPDDTKGTFDVYPSVLAVIVTGSIVVECTTGTVGVVPVPIVYLFSSAVGPIAPADTRIVGVFPSVLYITVIVGVFPSVLHITVIVGVFPSVVTAHCYYWSNIIDIWCWCWSWRWSAFRGYRCLTSNNSE